MIPLFVLVAVLARWSKNQRFSWNRMTARVVLCGLAILGGATTSRGSELKPIKLRSDYQHDRYVTQPTEIVRQFEAFTVSFDSKVDDGEARGIPDFVAYEMKRVTKPLGAGPARPSTWITDDALAAQRLAPTDASYQYSAIFLLSHRDWYERGHLCMKQHAWRLEPNDIGDLSAKNGTVERWKGSLPARLQPESAPLGRVRGLALQPPRGDAFDLRIGDGPRRVTARSMGQSLEEQPQKTAPKAAPGSCGRPHLTPPPLWVAHVKLRLTLPRPSDNAA